MDKNAVVATQKIELMSNIIYVIGGSFILGSLFTILLLLFLDFIRRNKPAN